MSLPDPLEADIQISLVDYLRPLEDPRRFLVFAVPNEGMGKARGSGGIGRMARLKRMGLRSGTADLVIVKDGRAFFLEMKRRGQKQRPSQVEFEADAIRTGAPYAVADSFESAIKILKSWKII